MNRHRRAGHRVTVAGRRGLRALLVVVLVGGVVATGGSIAQAAGPTLTTLTADTFTNATTSSAGWKVISGGAVNACLTAGSNVSQTPIGACSSSALDTAGNGALRLTNNSTSQVGTVYNTTSFPTSQGLDIRFNTFQWNGTTNPGADGIAFILAATDPSNPAPPAATGPLVALLATAPPAQEHQG